LLSRVRHVYVPKDRFAVSIIDVPTPRAMAGYGRKMPGIPKMPKMPKAQRIKSLIGEGKNNSLKAVYPWLKPVVKTDNPGAKLFLTMTRLLYHAALTNEEYYRTTVGLSHNQRDAPPEPDSGLFYPPVDDVGMSDCIKEALIHFFGEKETCKIGVKEYKMAAFCLLMHDYFIRANIMKDTTRKHFCDYLRDMVLSKEVMFSSRTFTNYANEYKDYEELFTSPAGHRFNFSARPEPSAKPLMDAFHEIGHYFHTSDYFIHLRVLRDNLAKFNL